MLVFVGIKLKTNMSTKEYHFFTEDDPADAEFSTRLDRQMVAETNKLTADLLAACHGATNDERYTLLKRYGDTRRRGIYEHKNGGDVTTSATISFSALDEIAQITDSVYLHRYIAWLKNIEVHEALEDQLPFVTEPDPEKTSPEVINWYNDVFEGRAYKSEQPGDIYFKYSDGFVATYDNLPPAEQALYDWGLKMLEESPFAAGDSGYYAPDPFTKVVARVEGLDLLPHNEVELAAETVNLFGLHDVAQLSERARRQLYHVGVNLDEENYERIKKSAEQLGEAGNIHFAEAFLATEFGDDLGEQIIAAAESGNNKRSEVLHMTRGILENVHSFTREGVFAQIDSGLADDVRRGISTRTAEVLYAFNQRVEKGKDSDKVLRALRKLEEWSRGVAEMLRDGIPQKVQQTGDTKLYHFIDPRTGEKYAGAVELTAFGKFKEDATAREQYVKEGRGARISLTYDESNSSAALSLYGTTRRSAMNGRFDKSVYSEQKGTHEPDAENAEVSFDIASEHAPAGSESRTVAEVIAEGSAIRETGHGRKGGKGNYTYDIINQKHGNRDTFASYVGRFGDVLHMRERSTRGRKFAAAAIETAHRRAG